MYSLSHDLVIAEDSYYTLFRFSGWSNVSRSGCMARLVYVTVYDCTIPHLLAMEKDVIANTTYAKLECGKLV